MALCRNLEHVPRTPVVDGLGIPGSAHRLGFPAPVLGDIGFGASDVRALCSAAFLHATADCHHSLTYA